MYIYIHTCVYIHIYIYIYIYIHRNIPDIPACLEEPLRRLTCPQTERTHKLYLHAYTRYFLCVCNIRVCVYIYIYVCVCVCVCMYVCVYVYAKLNEIFRHSDRGLGGENTHTHAHTHKICIDAYQVVLKRTLIDNTRVHVHTYTPNIRRSSPCGLCTHTDVHAYTKKY